jgi:HD-like signal output (HDOD) protein
MKRDLTTFIEKTGNPPSLPALYYELVRVVEQPDSSVSDLTALILQDQSLAARILKLANSAFYGWSSQIGTIERAIQVIGLREVQNLVLATSVIEAFDSVPAELVDVPSFWRHSISCGIAGAMLAEMHQEDTPERLFIGGLLHDIGRLVMFLNAPAESREILERCEQEGQLCCRIERDVLGFDHAALGAELAWLWKLPRPLIDMIECHHSPPESSPATRDAFFIHYADFITNTLEFGGSGELYVSPLIVPRGCEPYVLTSRMEAFIEELEKRCTEMLHVLMGGSKRQSIRS